MHITTATAPEPSISVAMPHLNNNNNNLKLSTILHWTICILSFGLGSLLEASPIRPTVAPKQLSRDCSTLIVTNERRLTPPKNGHGGGSTGDCNGRRQARKQLPPVVSRLFREEVENYPEEEIGRILKQTPNDVRDLYNVLNTQLDPNTNLTERMAYYPNNDEDGHVEREENVCRTVTRHIYPREANLHNSLVYIPNNHDFMQVIQAEMCHQPDDECGYLRDNLPYGMTSACVQKYSYKKLLYMDPLDKRMASDLFRYPSCCVCMVRTLPLDLRSNRGNQSSVNFKQASGTPSTTTPSPFAMSSSDTDSSAAANAAQYASANNGLGPQQQPSDRSHDSESSLPTLAKRTSKQLKRPTNQTLVLSEDKVYAPSR